MRSTIARTIRPCAPITMRCQPLPMVVRLLSAAPASSVSSVSTSAPTPVKKNKVHVLVGADGTRRYAFERNIPFADAYESLARRMDEVVQWTLEDHSGVDEISIYLANASHFQSRPQEMMKLVTNATMSMLRRISESPAISSHRPLISLIGDHNEFFKVQGSDSRNEAKQLVEEINNIHRRNNDFFYDIAEGEFTMSDAYDSRVARAAARAAAGGASSSDDSSVSPLLNAAVDHSPSAYPLGSGGGKAQDNRKRINLLLAWNGDKEFAKARLRCKRAGVTRSFANVSNFCSISPVSLFFFTGQSHGFSKLSDFFPGSDRARFISTSTYPPELNRWEYGLRVNQFLHLKDSLGKRAAEQLTKAQSEQAPRRV